MALNGQKIKKMLDDGVIKYEDLNSDSKKMYMSYLNDTGAINIDNPLKVAGASAYGSAGKAIGDTVTGYSDLAHTISQTPVKPEGDNVSTLDKLKYMVGKTASSAIQNVPILGNVAKTIDDIREISGVNDLSDADLQKFRQQNYDALGITKAQDYAGQQAQYNTANKVANWTGGVVGGVAPTIGTALATGGVGVMPQVLGQTLGSKRDEMLSTGDASSINEAIIKSLPYAVASAGVESIGGIGSAKGIKEVLKESILKQMKEEGLEEVYEDVIDNALDMFLMKNKTSDIQEAVKTGDYSKIIAGSDNSIIQPGQMALDFAGGALGGGIFGAVGKLTNGGNTNANTNPTTTNTNTSFEDALNNATNDFNNDVMVSNTAPQLGYNEQGQIGYNEPGQIGYNPQLQLTNTETSDYYKAINDQLQNAKQNTLNFEDEKAWNDYIESLNNEQYIPREQMTEEQQRIKSLNDEIYADNYGRILNEQDDANARQKTLNETQTKLDKLNRQIKREKNKVNKENKTNSQALADYQANRNAEINNATEDTSNPFYQALQAVKNNANTDTTAIANALIANESKPAKRRGRPKKVETVENTETGIAKAYKEKNTKPVETVNEEVKTPSLSVEPENVQDNIQENVQEVKEPKKVENTDYQKFNIDRTFGTKTNSTVEEDYSNFKVTNLNEDAKPTKTVKPLEVNSTKTNSKGIIQNSASFEYQRKNPKGYEALNKTCEKFDMELELRDDMQDNDWGYYDSDNNKLVINSKVNSQEALERVVTHESVHRMKELAPETYSKLQEAVLEVYNENDVEVVNKLREKYGEVYDAKDVDEEMVANLCGEFFSKDLGVFEKVAKKNPSVFQKFIDELKRVFYQVKDILSGVEYKAYKDKLDVAERRFKKLVKDATVDNTNVVDSTNVRESTVEEKEDLRLEESKRQNDIIRENRQGVKQYVSELKAYNEQLNNFDNTDGITKDNIIDTVTELYRTYLPTKKTGARDAETEIKYIEETPELKKKIDGIQEEIIKTNTSTEEGRKKFEKLNNQLANIKKKYFDESIYLERNASKEQDMASAQSAITEDFKEIMPDWFTEDGRFNSIENQDKFENIIAEARKVLENEEVESQDVMQFTTKFSQDPTLSNFNNYLGKLMTGVTTSRTKYTNYLSKLINAKKNAMAQVEEMDISAEAKESFYKRIEQWGSEKEMSHPDSPNYGTKLANDKIIKEQKAKALVESKKNNPFNKEAVTTKGKEIITEMNRAKETAPVQEEIPFSSADYEMMEEEKAPVKAPTKVAQVTNNAKVEKVTTERQDALKQFNTANKIIENIRNSQSKGNYKQGWQFAKEVESRNLLKDMFGSNEELVVKNKDDVKTLDKQKFYVDKVNDTTYRLNNNGKKLLAPDNSKATVLAQNQKLTEAQNSFNEVLNKYKKEIMNSKFDTNAVKDSYIDTVAKYNKVKPETVKQYVKEAYELYKKPLVENDDMAVIKITQDLEEYINDTIKGEDKENLTKVSSLANGIEKLARNMFLKDVRKVLGAEENFKQPSNAKHMFVNEGNLRDKAGLNTMSNSDKINEQTATKLKIEIEENGKYRQVGNAESRAKAVEFINSKVQDGDTDIRVALQKAVMDVQSRNVARDLEIPVLSEVALQYDKMGDYDEATTILEAVDEIGRQSGRNAQYINTFKQQLFRALSGNAKYNWLNKTVNKYNKEIETDKIIKRKPITWDEETQKKVKNELNQASKLREQITQMRDRDANEMLKNIATLGANFNNSLESKLVDKVQAVDSFTNNELVDIIEDEIVGKVLREGDTHVGKKISSYQVLSHLLNTSTLLRNVGGNEAFGGLEQLSKKFSKVIGSQLYGMKFDKSKSASYKDIRANAWEQFKKSTGKIMLGVDGITNKYNEKGVSNLDGKIPTFKNKILASGEKFLSEGLNATDNYAKEMAREEYVDMMKQQMSSDMFEQMREQINEDAEQYALYRTFQDDSLPAQMMGSIKKVLNTVNIGGFGIGDLVMKYTQVPGNLVARTCEYSPIGAIKGIAGIIKTNNNPNLTQMQKWNNVMQLSRGLTGTALMALGYALRSIGALTGDESDNEIINKLYKQGGVSAGKINLSGMFREGNGISDDDLLVSYDWLQPVSMIISTGSILRDEVAKGEKTGTFKTMGALGSAFENMMDLPCNQAINTIVSTIENDYSEEGSAMTNLTLGLFTSMCNGIGGFVPAPVKHLANAVDPTSRNIYGNTGSKSKDLMVETKKRVQNSIPGASTSLEPFVTANGEDLKYSDLGFFLNYLTQMSPVRTTEVNLINGTKELEQLFTLSNGENIAKTSNTPMRYAPNKTKYVNDNYEKGKLLTDKDKTQYMTAYAEYYNKNIVPSINAWNSMDLTDAEKEKVSDKMVKLQTEAKKYAELYAMVN